MRILNEFIEHEGLKGLTEGSLAVKKRNIERFLKHVDYQYKAVDSDDIESFLDELKGLSPERINLALSHIRQFYDYLLVTGKILLNPAEPIKSLKTGKENHSGIFTEEEVKELLRASSTHRRRKSRLIMKRDRAILELLYSTGLRVNELINLDVDDIDFRNREVNVYNAKGEKDRIIPVGDESLFYLKQYLKLRAKLVRPDKDLEALFISRQGNRLAGISVRRMIERRKNEAEVDSKGKTHAFRRSCASHMLRRGAPLSSIQRMLGHEHLETTQSYALVQDDDHHEQYRTSHPKA